MRAGHLHAGGHHLRHGGRRPPRALIKGGAALEQLGGAPVAFDKTGTLTVGQPQVTSVIATAEVDDNALLALAAAVEQGSSHRWRRLSSVKRSGVS